MLYSGRGNPVDLRQAIDYYEKAAVAGDATAINNLGILVEQGKGLTKNLQMSLDLYVKASEMVSHPVKRLSTTWFQSALIFCIFYMEQQGDANAAFNAGLLLKRNYKDLIHGDDNNASGDLPQEIDKALYYLDLAAQLGHPRAYDEMMDMIGNGSSQQGGGVGRGKVGVTGKSMLITTPKELSLMTLRALNLTIA